MVFDGRYKLTIDTATEQPVELFDLQADPREVTNFVNHPEYEQIHKELTDGHLQKHRQRLDKSTLEEIEKVRSPQNAGRLLGLLEALKKEKYS